MFESGERSAAIRLPVQSRPGECVAGDAGVAVWFSGRTDPGTAANHRHARRPDSDPGLFQFRPGLLAQPAGRRGALRRRPIGVDRRQ